MSAWFKKSRKPLSIDQKRNIPDGVWVKCSSCDEILFRKELARHLEVCPKCGYHFRMSSSLYCSLLLEKWDEHDAEMVSSDPLQFRDSMRYSERTTKYVKKSGLFDAIRCVTGEMNGRTVELAVMDFAFMGGSVGAVVGEKLNRAIQRAIDNAHPIITVSCSGGMRMQEGLFSLMQMAKVSATLAGFSKSGKSFISILTNPTTGGTTASFSMLGDIIISEPRALIGFAGPRVIKQTIGQDLPEGFQSAEFLLEHGFLDMIVERRNLKETVSRLIGLLNG